MGKGGRNGEGDREGERVLGQGVVRVGGKGEGKGSGEGIGEREGEGGRVSG